MLGTLREYATAKFKRLGLTRELAAAKEYWEHSPPNWLTTEHGALGGMRSFRSKEKVLWRLIIGICVKHMQSNASPASRGKLLEVGCGDCPYFDCFSGFECLVGVDLGTGHMLDNLLQSHYAHARARNQVPWILNGFPDKQWPAHGDYRFELAPVEHMEAALTLDYSLIFANFVLGYPSKADLQALLKQLYARLTTGGLMLVKENVCDTPTPRESYQGATYSPKELTMMFQTAGFKTVYQYRWESSTAEPQLFMVLSKETRAPMTLEFTLKKAMTRLTESLEQTPTPEVSQLTPLLTTSLL